MVFRLYIPVLSVKCQKIRPKEVQQFFPFNTIEPGNISRLGRGRTPMPLATKKKVNCPPYRMLHEALEDWPDTWFQGILANIIAIPHVSVRPANVSPAPTNAASPIQYG